MVQCNTNGHRYTAFIAVNLNKIFTEQGFAI